MKSFNNDLKKYAEKIALKVSERHELRERILSYMEYHPLPKQILKREELEGAIPSESFVRFHFNSFQTRIVGGIFIAFLIITPFIAERSVPGDVLYLVKTGFNEQIQGQLANSPYEKIEFETKLMERRITEARLLASEGKLTEAVKTQIAETVKEHTEAVQDGLAELRVQDAEGAAIAQIAFNSSLEVQSAVLGVNESTDNASLIDSILTVVNEAHDEVASNQIDEKPSFEGLTAQVELETTRAFELFTTVKISATHEEIADIERRLSDIDRLILEAEEKHETEPEVAVTDLVATLGLIQKLILFMTDIDIRETVALETLVPVVLSDEERVARVKEENESIGTLNAIVAERIENIADTGVKEKIVEGVARVEELLLQSVAALEGTDIESAENSIKEANAIVTDIDMLSQHSGVGFLEDEPEDVTTEEVTATSTEEVSSTTPTV